MSVDPDKRIDNELGDKQNGGLIPRDGPIPQFSTKDALKIKSIEEKINHDVKSIEYYLIEKFNSNKSLKNKKELIHFCATSEDINNISYALMFKENKILLIKELNKLIKEINFLVKKYSNTPMLSRTHGQKASPTTFGKEMKVFSSRLKKFT